MAITLHDPVRAVDIAYRLGVVPSTVENWQARKDDFPSPTLYLGYGNREWADDLEEWFRWLTHSRVTLVWEWEDIAVWYREWKGVVV